MTTLAIRYSQISEEDINYAIDNREFSNSLLNTSSRVVLILTQSWCSQWIEMKSWLSALGAAKGANQEGAADPISVFYYEYDKTLLFDRFRVFKETHWNNHEVPYVRYYSQGALIAETNYVTQSEFFTQASL